jgi:pyruvate/2-oxoglutarate dehydrogenase complex dihydrolipoamide dehydrogenase (E3) component/uncharacterized membrane protein YdjX (TVP38/TMEM64 family)
MTESKRTEAAPAEGATDRTPTEGAGDRSARPAQPGEPSARGGPGIVGKALVLLLLAGLIAAYIHYDLGQYLTLSALQARHAELTAYRDAQPLATSAVFFGIYVLATALSLPGATLLTLAGGAIFGLWWGTLLISFASTLGATLACLSARYLLRDGVQTRFAQQLAVVNAGIARDGGTYLFTLRLIPLVPFFVINLVAGLTPLGLGTFYWVSQLGMLPGTLVYVNAGTVLADLHSLAGIFSPQLILAFALLGLFPWLARVGVGLVRRRAEARRFDRPATFERDLVVIGGGAAGLVSAYIGAVLKARVTLIERDRMGGDCLNTGCVPSKALIRAGRLCADLRRAPEFGIRVGQVDLDFGAIMARVHEVIRRIEPHDSMERYRSMGVECVAGEARLLSPWRVQVGERAITTRAVIVATGARPRIPEIPGLAEAEPLTSDTLWGLQELPRRLIILGAGPVGCEMAQCFARLGAQVTLVEKATQILPREDADVAACVEARLRADGVLVLTGLRAERFSPAPDGGHRLHAVRLLGEGGSDRQCTDPQDTDVQDMHGQDMALQAAEGPVVEVVGDRVLVAVGRAPWTSGLGLAELGIALRADGAIAVDEHLHTGVGTIYACGDVTGHYQLTHAAAHEAWHAAVNALFAPFYRFRVDFSVLPWVTFTEPEVARVGLSEAEAQARGIPYEVTRYDLAELDRAIADGEIAGLVKVLTVPGKDQILGAAVVATRAGELIGEFALAMRGKLGLGRILGTVHAYPTWLEANKFAAGAWKKAHAPARVLGLLARWHAFRRGGA